MSTQGAVDRKCRYGKWLGALAMTLLIVTTAGAEQVGSTGSSMDWIELDSAGTRFVVAATGKRFTPWGLNYDRDAGGRLLEDYWIDEWDTVVDDFREMKSLGANTVRIHLQLPAFMGGPEQVDEAALAQLSRLLELADTNRLYLILTGLGTYRIDDIPGWYQTLAEAARWRVQARFWQAIAMLGHDHPSVFAYDLMNEPMLPTNRPRPPRKWVTGKLGDWYYAQYLSLDLAGRRRDDVAAAWVQTMVAAIRKHDQRHLITVGAAALFPLRVSAVYSAAALANLDFVSIHLYPRSGRMSDADVHLDSYQLGKPLVVSETFPLRCSMDEMARFIAASRTQVQGWLGFYWGQPASQIDSDSNIKNALICDWQAYFRARAAIINNAE